VKVDPKVCMPSWRKFDHAAYQSNRYESQDVLAEACDLDLLCLEPAWSFAFREAWQRRLVWKDFTGVLKHANPGLKPVRVEKDYDLFVLVCQTPKELLLINAVKGWRDHCKTAVCIIDELYAQHIRRAKPFFDILDQFDHLIIELRESVDPLSQLLGRSCHNLPAAVDALRFSPYPTLPPRVVDVYSIGRRREGIHASLKRMAKRDQLFCIHDTFQGGAEAKLTDYRAHRDLVASIAKRSRFFVVAPAKWDQPKETRGQVGIANRYFEGAAAGAVLIGQPSDTDEFRELVDWEQAVVPIAEDGSDVEAVVQTLLADPEKTWAISRRNVAQALLRHDWVYRWHRLFDLVGIAPGPSMRAREERLRALARMAVASAPPLERREIPIA
jgi:Glycosyl transferases group 1